MGQEQEQKTVLIYLGRSGSVARFTQPENLERLLNDNRYPKDLDYWNGLVGQLRWMKEVKTGGYVTFIYTQAYHAVRLLIEKYGLEKLQSFIQEMETSPSFENAFQKVYGTSTRKFSQTFLDSAQQYTNK